MREYTVTMKGRWTRERTHSSDITMVRKLSYRIRQFPRDGHMGAVTALTIRADRLEHGDKDVLQTRTGTFIATVTFPTQAYLSQAMRNGRAKTYLKWAMQDAFCRSPKLSDIVVTRGGSQYV